MTLDIHKLQRLKNTLILPLQMITELDGRTVFSETLGYDSPSNSLGGPSYTGLITRKGETWTIPTGPSPSQIQQVSRTEDYAYDYAARLSGWDDASNGENISYDARGNITQRVPRHGSGGTLTFESAPFDRGRLTEVGVRYHVTDHLGSVRAVIHGNASTTTYPLTGFYSIDDFAPFGIKSASSASSYLSLASTGSTVSLRDGFTGQEDQ